MFEAARNDDGECGGRLTRKSATVIVITEQSRSQSGDVTRDTQIFS